MSHKTFLARLARASGSELRFRCGERARVGSEAIAFTFRRPRWNREQLSSQILPLSDDLVRARRALRRSDWSAAHQALRSHFASRAPRFPLDPSRREWLTASVLQRNPSASADARGRAARLLEGHYDVLGYSGLDWSAGDGRVDWHWDPVHRRRAPTRFWAKAPYLDPQFGDHKVVWEINRHQHWLALGRAAWLIDDPRYAAAFRTELSSWLSDNPPLTGGNWASMLEIAFRSISWLWALHFFTPFDPNADDRWLVDLLLALNRQMHHVSRHLSVYFSPNTHLLGEGLALYVVGRAVPELKHAGRWEEIGRTVLLREATAQVYPDGGHAELSAHYHRYALDFYLLALAVARRTHDPAATSFAEVASRMASFCRAIADDSGRLPRIGDDDGGLLFPLCGRAADDASASLAVAAAFLAREDLLVGDPVEEVLWMSGGELSARGAPTSPATPTSRLFSDSGYAVLRSPAAHAVVDVGRHGFLNGGHAHADALSLVVSIHGRPLLIDPGTATYTMDPGLRDRFRSTAMHNTVVLDGRPQSVPDGPFHWRSSADASVGFWRGGSQFNVVEAQHNGYLPEIHRRMVLRAPDDSWFVADYILGTGHHRFDAHWHLDPAWTLSGISGGAAQLAHPDRLWATIASTAGAMIEFHGDEGGLGWCAPVYGHVVPSLTLRLSQSGDTPVSSITAICSTPDPVHLTMSTASVQTREADGWYRAAAVGRRGESSCVALFATPQDPAPASDDANRPPRGIQEVAGWGGRLATDARIAVLWLSPSGQATSLLLVGATVAAWRGAVDFTVGPLAAATDLHLTRTSLARLSHRTEQTTGEDLERTLCAE